MLHDVCVSKAGFSYTLDCIFYFVVQVFILLKKNNRTIATYFSGGTIIFTSNSGAYIEANITSIKNDTLIQQGLEKVEKEGIDRTIIEKYLKVKE